MTPIEIMALIIAGFTLVKLAVIMYDPRKWMPVVKAVYSNPARTQLVGLVLAAGSLMYLLRSFSIVDIFAVMFFFVSLMMVGVSAFSKELLKLSQEIMKKKDVLKRSALPFLIWAVLCVWVFKELFV